MRSYKYRLYPNEEQRTKLWRHANLLNTVYNNFLQERIEAYQQKKKAPTRLDQQAQLVLLKLQYPELQEIHSQVLQQVPKRLDLAYQQFFQFHTQGHGFPHFRSCKHFFGICYPQQGYSLQGAVFKTKVYGNIPFYPHREYSGVLRQVYITTENNQWFLILTCDEPQQKEAVSPLKVEVLGVDVGITNIVALSTGEIRKNRTDAKYFDREINKLKSHRDSKCQKGSRRFKRLSRTIRRLYEMKNRKVNGFLHKVSKNLSCQSDTIVCEDLNLKAMSETYKTGLNRELRNSKLGFFLLLLKYKCKRVLQVNPRNTSKTCNHCGSLQEMPLWNRTYKCLCGWVIDRDLNASLNLFCLGQAILLGFCHEKSSIQDFFSLSLPDRSSIRCTNDFFLVRKLLPPP
jgi:putative transposase